MGYIPNYITKNEYDDLKSDGHKHFIGFVIGYGYITTKCKVMMPPNQNGYSPIWTNMPSAQTHCFLYHEYEEDTSLKAVKLSLRGLFKNGETAISVESGMTLSHIAMLFDVTVDELVRWNNIKNPDKIRVGQRIKILDNVNGIPEYIRRPELTASDEVSGLDQNLCVKDVSQNRNWFKDNIVSQTITHSDHSPELDFFVFKVYRLLERTKGNSKTFNHNIVTLSNKGMPKSIANSYELNLGYQKMGVSNTSIYSSISLLGLLEGETSVEFNDIWDFSINLSVKENVNLDDLSTGFGFEITPAKVVLSLAVIAGAFFLGGMILQSPVLSPSPTYSIGPVLMNNNEL